MTHSLTDTQWKQIDGYIAGGQKIQAIKLYREFTNAGLAEAKDAIDARAVFVESGLAPPQDSGGQSDQSQTPDLAADQWKQIDEHLFSGRKLHAIKLYRDWTECDLVDSKKTMESRELDLRQHFPLRFTEKKSGCLGSIVLLFALVAPIVYILLTRAR